MFDSRSRFCLNQTSFTPNELEMRRRAIWALRVFHVRLPAARILVKIWRYLVHSRKGLGPRVIP